MNTKNKIRCCLFFNLLILIITITLVLIFRDENSKYLRIGPYEDLVLISVQIDTWKKWAITVFVIGFINVGDLLVNEIGNPILGFNVYNPDKKIIDEFSKNELNFLANSMWSINNIRQVFTIIISVSQVDMALFNVLITSIANIFTTRMLLNEKEFVSGKYSPVSSIYENF